MKHTLILTFLLATLLTACTSSGAFLSSNQTLVNLNEGNYTLTATNITGEAEAAYLLGLSYSTGFIANTFALARVEGTGMLYTEALEDLWENYENDFGMSKDRKLALANVRYDSDILNLFLYTKVKIMIRADIVEFQ